MFLRYKYCELCKMDKKNELLVKKFLEINSNYFGQKINDMVKKLEMRNKRSKHGHYFYFSFCHDEVHYIIKIELYDFIKLIGSDLVTSSFEIFIQCKSIIKIYQKICGINDCYVNYKNDKIKIKNALSHYDNADLLIQLIESLTQYNWYINI